MFNTQVINGLALPDLGRCLSLETADEFDSFIFEVFGHVSTASLNGQRLLRRTSMRIQRAKRFIEQYAFEDISLGDIASSINVSPFTCLRQFRSATGETPHDYLSRLRLVRAQQLLRDRRLAIGEVAARIGIRDRSYFTRWFSRHVGMTPGKFRERP
jgi:AraC-like DNA-binding protein